MESFVETDAVRATYPAISPAECSRSSRPRRHPWPSTNPWRELHNDARRSRSNQPSVSSHFEMLPTWRLKPGSMDLCRVGFRIQNMLASDPDPRNLGGHILKCAIWGFGITDGHALLAAEARQNKQWHVNKRDLSRTMQAHTWCIGLHVRCKPGWLQPSHYKLPNWHPLCQVPLPTKRYWLWDTLHLPDVLVYISFSSMNPGGCQFLIMLSNAPNIQVDVFKCCFFVTARPRAPATFKSQHVCKRMQTLSASSALGAAIGKLLSA